MVPRVSAVLQRLLLVAGGVLTALVVLEGTLQVASLFTRGSRGGEISTLLGAGRRIVCLGDSNTYGLWVKRPEAYPEVLQQVLKAGLGSGAMQVVNLGAPGANSSRLRGKLGEVLYKLRPDLILLMVGANDLWTAPAPVDDMTTTDWIHSLWRHSRLFRLVYMQRRVFESEQFEVTFKAVPDGSTVARSNGEEVDLTWTGRARARVVWQDALRENLVATAQQARDAGTELLLLTYASDSSAYGLANAIIRAAASESDVPLVDLASTFSRVCPSSDCPDLFFRDQHPTARGHQLVAALLWQYLTGTQTARR